MDIISLLYLVATELFNLLPLVAYFLYIKNSILYG